MDIITTDGRPIPIDRVWFRARYGQNFPDLLEESKSEFLDTCIQDVYTLFYGVADLWKRHTRQVYEQKTQMCYGLLVAWYIADLFPSYTVGVITTGGIPLKGKKIGGVTVSFGDTASIKAGNINNADLLSSLKSNAFGAKAYTMVKTSGKLNFFIATGEV